MAFLNFLLGRRLASSEAEKEQVGPAVGVSNLGLDALGSAAYGPEAALTILIPLGMFGLARIQLILGLITLLLLILFISYRQTIAAYPGGGGSYVVAKENLGVRPGLCAAAALLVDYILNVAVGISAGVGALSSAFPSLQPHRLALCLLLLVLVTLANLRGVRQSGLLWSFPTYLFIASLGAVLLTGVWKGMTAGGAPVAVVPPPPVPEAVMAVNAWVLIHAFASGCTAMTGVEAVSNAVPIFREPRVANAQKTLLIICSVLGVFLLALGYLSRTYGIAAMPQEFEGYQSVISQMAAAVVGRGWLYYLCIISLLTVLALSANTSFSAFPRLCRLLAEDGFLPPSFANLGRRLVYTEGIIVLFVISACLLVLFNGITDRLIPLFAVGAFMAFTFSQAGMTLYWIRTGNGKARGSLLINAIGTVTTGVALVTITVAKFTEGAWMTLLLAIGLVALFAAIGRHYRQLRFAMRTTRGLEIAPRRMPLMVIPIAEWNQLAARAMQLSMQFSDEVVAVNISNDEAKADALRALWKESVEAPAIAAGRKPPRLEIVASPYRLLHQPLLDFLRKARKEDPGRLIAVVIPELARPRWWEYLLHNYSVALLKTLLLIDGGEQVAILSTAWYLRPRLKNPPPRHPL
ncbi:MAG TPA: APC family permease [Chthoniobacteraceae bacterium]|nr:APC family permease [Chthoniobacteraceae bacterium]